MIFSSETLCFISLQVLICFFPSNNQMFIGDYSQFLDTQMDLSLFGPMPTSTSPSDSSFLCPPTLAHYDMVYSEFTETISKRLTRSSYPSSFESHNPLCPLCLKQVQPNESYSGCFIASDQQYLIHKQCLTKHKGYDMRNVETQQNGFSFTPAKTIDRVQFEQGFERRDFYVQVCLSHPLGDKNVLRLSKKANLVRNHFRINFNENEENSFFPNIVAVPCTDYTLTVNISEVGKKKNHIKFTKYLPLKKINQSGKISAASEEVILEVEVVADHMQQQMLTQTMNYKYKYPLNNVSMVRIHGLKIQLPDDFEQEESSQELIMGSGNIDQLLNQSSFSTFTVKTGPKQQLKSSQDSSSSNQSQKINLQKLISTNTLLDFVKNNNQSRTFQQFLSECSSQEIQSVVKQIKPALVELITHQYGNYMIQKLFTVCTPAQRLDLLQVILPQFPALVRNKQGTHTLQAFISLFTLNQQFMYTVMAINQQFYNLCLNNNATHFIQKIIKSFPLDYTINLFYFVTENLMAFALDKNAMCVIKHMMRRLRQLQGKAQHYNEYIESIRKQIIVNVTFNVHQLISDSYGNYVIQFCYELFDEAKCAGITQAILYHFTTYSIGKFSNNVLLKCISTYWTDLSVYNTLKELSSQQIIEVFRNKDGNRILLQVMERLEGIQFWDKLYTVLTRVQPTRFYHDRWGVCLGIRSSQAFYRGGEFPQGKRNSYNRKK